MFSGRAHHERGASGLEYGALILVGAIIVGTLVTLVSTRVEGRLANAVCGVFGGQCADTRQGAGGTGDGGGGPGADGAGHGPTLLPSPSPGPPVPQPPAPPPPKEQSETEAVLNETQLGRDALTWVKDHGVRVIYRSGGGSYYDGDANVFYVDTKQSPEDRANTFVHEVNHAEHRNDPDIKKLSRDEFIDKSIDEETEGTVEAIQNNQELQRNRNGNAPGTLLQQEYEDAYNAAVARENAARQKAQRPPLDAAGEKAVGEKAGRERVKQAFVNGEVVSSVDKHKYADNYGKAWDDAHDCFLWIFC